MINADFVTVIHDEILTHERGLQGYTNHGALESCLGRIDNQMLYDPLNDIFDIASFYAVVIAKAHAFADGNKRTALVTMLTYLDLQGVSIVTDVGLDDVMVDVASEAIDRDRLARFLVDNLAF